MIGQTAIAIALPGFNDLGRSVTPIFLLMDHFLYRFSTCSEKKEENISLSNSFFLAIRLSWDGFKCLLNRRVTFVSFFLVTVGVVCAIDPLLQIMTRIVFLRRLTFDIFNYKPS